MITAFVSILWLHYFDTSPIGVIIKVHVDQDDAIDSFVWSASMTRLTRTGAAVSRTVFTGLKAAIELLEARRVMSSAYQFSVIAKTGDAAITGFDPEVSINNVGDVGYVARNPNETLWVKYSSQNQPTQINPGIASASRNFSYPQVIDNGQVVAQERFSGSPPATLIRRWSATNQYQIVTQSGNRPGPPLDWDSVLLSSANNVGGTSFIGIAGTTTSLSANFGVDGDDTVYTTLSGGGFRPMIADSGTIVLRRGGTATDPIVTFAPPRTIADTSRFSAIGAAPGISDDGTVIAFYGVLTSAGATAINASQPGFVERITPGPGIFASYLDGATRYTIRLAGASQNGVLDPGETPIDLDGNGTFNGNEDFGIFDSFSADTRIGVNGAEGVYTAVFLANSGSTQSVYTNSLVRDSMLRAVNQDRVLSVGEQIAGVGATTAIALFDPINREGSIALHVTAAAAQAVVRATLLDTDGDGLYDKWEGMQGIDLNGDGLITANVDLLLTGADPMRKDLFVEVDAMADFSPPDVVVQTPGVDPMLLTGTILDNVVTAFQNMPVSNGAGIRPGINLHIELDQTEQSIPVTAIAGMPGLQAFRSEHIGTASQRTNPLIISARRRAYRYAVLGSTYTGEGNTDGTSTGLGEFDAIKGGSTFMVTLGSPRWTAANPDILGGTFMHELGHTLGLNDGGGDPYNNKPNYISVMNYLWQFPPVGRNPNIPKNGFKYIYSDGSLPTLDENALSESAGIGGRPSTKTVAFYNSPNGLIDHLVDELGRVDWNGNGIIDSGTLQQPVNINGNVGTTLEDHDDYAALRFRIPFYGFAAPGAALPYTVETNITADEWRAIVEAGAATRAPIVEADFEDENFQRLALRFSEDVGPSLTASDFTLLDTTTGIALPTGAFTLEYFQGTRTARIRLANNALLADGKWRLTISSAGVVDPQGDGLDGNADGTAGDDFAFTFHVLAGDANRDHVVNFSDLLILAQNYGQSGRAFSHGNFDYSTDGLVSFADLLLVAQRYGTSLPALNLDGGAAFATGKRKPPVAADVLA